MKYKTKKCDQCGKSKPIADTFVYEGDAYCMDCLYPLIMAIAEKGNLYINMNNCEEDGLIVSF